MKKLLVSIALLFSIVPAYTMEEDRRGGKWEEGDSPPEVVLGRRNKLAARDDESEKAEEGEERALMRFPDVYFSPNNIQDVLIKLISEEKKQLRGAWYRFTLYKPALAIAEQLMKKVAVSLVIDKSNFGGSYVNDEGDFCEGLALIAKNGGNIYKKVRPRNPENKGNFEIMHHKFMIFENNVSGKKLIGTGSFNGTGQANLKSDENWMILDDEEIVRRFEEEYKAILALSDVVTEKECTSTKTKKRDRKTNFARDMNDIPR